MSECELSKAEGRRRAMGGGVDGQGDAMTTGLFDEITVDMFAGGVSI